MMTMLAMVTMMVTMTVTVATAMIDKDGNNRQEKWMGTAMKATKNEDVSGNIDNDNNNINTNDRQQKRMYNYRWAMMDWCNDDGNKEL